jgi:hypothetical protein
MDMITGIPSHTLLVHLPVIAIPLAAVLVVLFTAIPRWRSVLAYLITGMGVVISAGVVLAASSGESLQETVDKSSLVDKHAELGDQLQTIGVIYGLSLVALGLYFILSSKAIISLGEQHSSTVLAALMGVTLVLSVAASVWDVRTGHSGAKATWTEERGGEQGEAAALVAYIVE